MQMIIGPCMPNMLAAAALNASSIGAERIIRNAELCFAVRASQLHVALEPVEAMEQDAARGLQRSPKD